MPYVRTDVKNVFGFSTLAKCPKCDKLHKIIIDWKGRGMPRKYCQMCLHNMGHMSSGMDDCGYNKYAATHHSQGRP